MSKHYTIEGKYWEIIDNLVADYKKTDEYNSLSTTNNLDKKHAASWLTNRLDKSAPLGKLAAECFTVTDSEIFGLIKIIEVSERDDTDELLDYLKALIGEKNEQINS